MPGISKKGGVNDYEKKILSVVGKIYVVLLFLFIYAPVAVMIAFSFNDSRANAML